MSWVFMEWVGGETGQRLEKDLECLYHSPSSSVRQALS